MRRLLILLVIFSMIILPACGARSQSADALSPPLESGVQEGNWELVCENYRPVSYDPCNAVYFPKFEGKTKEEWENYSVSIGRIDNTFITWAVAGLFSADKHYLIYASNKDCLEVDNALSVFLLDMYSGKERILLSGRDGHWYSAIAWLDDDTLLCESTTSYTSTEGPTREYLICDLEGNAIPFDPGESAWPYPFAIQGRMLAWVVGPEHKSVRLVHIEEDGSVSELAQQQFDGDPVNWGGISPDGKWMAFPLHFDDQDASDRAICLWNTEDGSVSLLENPIPHEGSDPAVISVRWNGEHLQAEFYISNAPDSNGHQELWRYIF